MSADFSVKSNREGDWVILEIAGDITQEVETSLSDAFESASNQSGSIIMNFTHSQYINSAGIAILISFLNRLNERGGKLVLSGLNRHFRKVIETVGLTDFLKVAETVEEAKAI